MYDGFGLLFAGGAENCGKLELGKLNKQRFGLSYFILEPLISIGVSFHVLPCVRQQYSRSGILPLVDLFLRVTNNGH